MTYRIRARRSTSSFSFALFGLIVLLASAVGAVTYLALFSGNINIVNRVSTESKVETAAEPVVVEQELVTPESQTIYVEPEYFNSVNTRITLEELQNSKVVRSITMINEGSPVATAAIFICNAEVVGITGRVLTLTKEGDTLAIYIGSNTEIDLAQGIKTRAAEFEEIKIGDFVNIGGALQTARGDPLWLDYLTILQR